MLTWYTLWKYFVRPKIIVDLYTVKVYNIGMIKKVNKIRTNIYLGSQQQKELQILAQQKDVSVASIIRYAINEYLGKLARKNATK